MIDPELFQKFDIVYLNSEFPVYDDDDEIVGYTSKGDKAIITALHGYNGYGNPVDRKEFTLEFIITSGEHEGYNNLALTIEDVENEYILTKHEWNNLQMK